MASHPSCHYTLRFFAAGSPSFPSHCCRISALLFLGEGLWMNWLVHLGNSFSFFLGEASWEFFNQPSIILLLAVALTSWRDKRQQERSEMPTRAGKDARTAADSELVQSGMRVLERGQPARLQEAPGAAVNKLAPSPISHGIHLIWHRNPGTG